jgi:hypothetical protein
MKVVYKNRLSVEKEIVLTIFTFFMMEFTEPKELEILT